MPRNLTRKLIATHLEDGDMTAGCPIALHIDQTLTQDATGTLVMHKIRFANALSEREVDGIVNWRDVQSSQETPDNAKVDT